MPRVLLLTVTSFCAALFPLAACGDEGAPPSRDLPADWAGANLIDGVRQTACQGSPYDGTPEAMTAAASGRSIHVAYTPAHFRCAQSVQGFVKLGAGTADVLVQPIDMNPATVAKCDCLYGVEMDIPVTSGAYSVTVYRRWDHQSGGDTPLKIGSASVTIQ